MMAPLPKQRTTVPLFRTSSSSQILRRLERSNIEQHILHPHPPALALMRSTLAALTVHQSPHSSLQPLVLPLVDAATPPNTAKPFTDIT